MGRKEKRYEKTLTIDIGQWYRPLDYRFEPNPQQINPHKSIFFAHSYNGGFLMVDVDGSVVIQIINFIFLIWILN